VLPEVAAAWVERLRGAGAHAVAARIFDSPEILALDTGRAAQFA
jgi:hypothetical protein